MLPSKFDIPCSIFDIRFPSFKKKKISNIEQGMLNDEVSEFHPAFLAEVREAVLMPDQMVARTTENAELGGSTSDQ